MDTTEPEARLGITNHSIRLLEVALEPLGEDFWLRPEESIVIIAVGSEGPQPWSGNRRTHAPFDVVHYPDAVAVHCNGAYAWATDEDGNQLECGHQRPESQPPTAKRDAAVYQLSGPSSDLHS